MNHTTRKFPRSIAEAFPADRYGSVQGPYKRNHFERIADAAFAIALGIVAAALAVHFLAR